MNLTDPIPYFVKYLSKMEANIKYAIFIVSYVHWGAVGAINFLQHIV